MTTERPAEIKKTLLMPHTPRIVPIKIGPKSVPTLETIPYADMSAPRFLVEAEPVKSVRMLGQAMPWESPKKIVGIRSIQMLGIKGIMTNAMAEKIKAVAMRFFSV